MKQNFRIWLMSGVFISGLVSPVTFAQNKSKAVTQENKANQPDVQQPWSLKVNKDIATLIGLKAQDAPLNELAQDLSKQLGLPVRLSPVMAQQRITAELNDASLETTARSLAPLAYLDETINAQNGLTEHVLGVYLSGLNEAKPDRRANLKEQNETILFVGSIGEEGESSKPEEVPLQVKIENGLLNVHARRQPVAVVLYEIAQQFGVPFELRGEVDQLVDLNVQGQRLEDVLRQLSAPIQLTRRMNLLLNESEPLRIILLAQPTN